MHNAYKHLQNRTNRQSSQGRLGSKKSFSAALKGNPAFSLYTHKTVIRVAVFYRGKMQPTAYGKRKKITITQIITLYLWEQDFWIKPWQSSAVGEKFIVSHSAIDQSQLVCLFFTTLPEKSLNSSDLHLAYCCRIIAETKWNWGFVTMTEQNKKDCRRWKEAKLLSFRGLRGQNF